MEDYYYYSIHNNTTEMKDKMEDPELGLLDVTTRTEEQFHSSTASLDARSYEESLPTDETVVSSLSRAYASTNTDRTTYWLMGAGFIAIVILGAFVVVINRYNQNKFFFEFQSFASEFHHVAQINVDNVVGQLRTLGVSITSTNAKDQSAPNVIIHDIDRRAQVIANASWIEMIVHIPLVEASQRDSWETYAVQNQGWIASDYKYRGWNETDIQSIPEQIHNFDYGRSPLFGFERSEIVKSSDETITESLSQLGYVNGRPLAPISQYGPGIVDPSLLMMDLFSHPTFSKDLVASLEFQHTSISIPKDLSLLLDCIAPHSKNIENSKRSFVLHPVKDDFKPDAKVIGFLMGIVSWEDIFRLKLPETVNGLDVVVKNACGEEFTYVANGGKPSTFADGDNHDLRYDRFASEQILFQSGDSGCNLYSLVIYPTDELKESFDLVDVLYLVGIATLIIAMIGGIFVARMRYAKRRQAEIMNQAKRAEAIVTSIFPKDVGLRLIRQAQREEEDPRHKRPSLQRNVSSKKMLKSFLAKGIDSAPAPSERRKPIAELFPSTTIMFADIVGFTAWSSTRQPPQVFVLLETVYEAFDACAKKRDVFKVETVRDCYVAVCGVPEPRRDHTERMALFANDCLRTMSVQVHELEVELGPDTADLGIRIGLHSGPVTAGVLRGDRARFQLFGDTMNTCARIESTGNRNRVHVSKETAHLLASIGREHWVIPRNDKVYAKGKGEIQTYWLKRLKHSDHPSIPRRDKTFSFSERNTQAFPDTVDERRVLLLGGIQRKPQDIANKKLDRLVDWCSEVLMTLLKQVEERRETLGTKPDDELVIRQVEDELLCPVWKGGKAAFDEVVESIEMARFNEEATRMIIVEEMERREQVQKELREYVRIVASMYNDNPFHNFEHASHVTMSVMKLLSRIVAPDIEGDESQLHDHTYGITSDPLTQFAVVFSALLHDLDHLGVPNSQLVKEVPELSRMYKGKSVAEQNSIDLAWALLMEDQFETLRQSIYRTTAELERFRQLVVNTVLATDIMDKELKALRNAKWDKAFAQKSVGPRGTLMEVNNRKATVVIEHLIQASDIAHTMQHWQVYRKWNYRLFKEMYRAFLEGHSDMDPSDGWYQGEIGFFDFYIIPLAKKLDDCGVFGVSSHEYLNYAEQNRIEWEKKGRQIVADYVQQAREELGVNEPEFDL